MVVGDQRPCDGVPDSLVVPDDCGQCEHALGDPCEQTVTGFGVVSFEAELAFAGGEGGLDDLPEGREDEPAGPGFLTLCGWA